MLQQNSREHNSQSSEWVAHREYNCICQCDRSTLASAAAHANDTQTQHFPHHDPATHPHWQHHHHHQQQKCYYQCRSQTRPHPADSPQSCAESACTGRYTSHNPCYGNRSEPCASTLWSSTVCCPAEELAWPRADAAWRHPSTDSGANST